ncbi:hypothetical protein O181_043859 [Austropuccinia psidii MF-1]|uniref:Chromo domain-containing protein n=1 Tax=Austropuccinia psidii MF-1 TaxID=1389203 RepID=A0A9Q3HIV3_9BASI|nr:hypothetical protein [Austropuccinia psidii MF-1]
MYFITQFLFPNNFDSILVAVDRFSKLAILIPTSLGITALDLAQILIIHVFFNHGLPVSIVSDRGSLFVSSFILDPIIWTDREGKSDSRKVSSDVVQQLLKEELESAIRPFKKYANWNRKISPDFQPGDRLWLASKNISTTRPTKKLSERLLETFEVLKNICSHSYQLKFPQPWKLVHPVFHVSLSEPVKQSTIRKQHKLPPPPPPPPPPVLVKKQEEWEVTQVLDSNLKRGKLLYLEEWKRFTEDPERTTWEPVSNLTNSPEFVKDFHTFCPDKPGPNTSRV